MRNHVAVGIAIVVASVWSTSARAQSERRWDALEVGGLIELAHAAPGGTSQWSAFRPVGLRVAWVDSLTPWGLDMTSEWNADRVANGVRYRERAAPVRLSRRVGRGTGPRGIAGTYVALGPSLRRFSLEESRTSKLMLGVTGGVGQRFSLGRGVVHPEVTYVRDFARNSGIGELPGTSGVGFRTTFSYFAWP